MKEVKRPIMNTPAHYKILYQMFLAEFFFKKIFIAIKSLMFIR